MPLDHAMTVTGSQSEGLLSTIDVVEPATGNILGSISIASPIEVCRGRRAGASGAAGLGCYVSK